VQVFAGPYLSVLVGGHYESQATYLNASHALVKAGKVVAGEVGGTLDDKAYSRRVDAGLQAGIRYRYGATVVQASYSLGLRNLASDMQLNPVATPIAQNAYYNRAFQLSLAYLFGPKS
jgi:predicted alpha-1,6-mannanase (GH76 family)